MVCPTSCRRATCRALSPFPTSSTLAPRPRPFRSSPRRRTVDDQRHDRQVRRTTMVNRSCLPSPRPTRETSRSRCSPVPTAFEVTQNGTDVWDSTEWTTSPRRRAGRRSSRGNRTLRHLRGMVLTDTQSRTRSNRNFRRFRLAGPDRFVRDLPDPEHALSDPIGSASIESTTESSPPSRIRLHRTTNPTPTAVVRALPRVTLSTGRVLQGGAKRSHLGHSEGCQHQQGRRQVEPGRTNRDRATRIDGGV